MTLDTIIEILKAVLSGKTGPFEAVQSNPLLILIPFIMALLGFSGRFLSMPSGPRVGSAIFCFLLAGCLAAGLVMGPKWLSAAPTDNRTTPPTGHANKVPTNPGVPSPPRTVPTSFESKTDHTLTSRPVKPPFNVGGKEECEKACGAEAECRAYSYDTETKSCALRMQVGNPMPFKGSIIGIKK